MNRPMMIALMLTLALAGHAHADQARLGYAEAEPAARPATVPEALTAVALAPESWNQDDPADSLYRAAREAMNRREHERAARLFRQVWERFPRSTYAPDAPYWEAFNRYRLDDDASLKRALESLEVQRERYAQAETRQNGDALSLETRIHGILAGRGDEDAAESIAIAVNELTGAFTDPQFVARMERLGEEIGARVAEQSERIAQEVAVVAERAARIAANVGSGGMRDIPEQCREEVELQLTALNALMQMNADRAMPMLKKVMARRDECAPPLRRKAVFLIADSDSPEAVDLLLDAARSDPDVDVRRQAVFWLSEVDDARAIDALQQVLRDTDDEPVRERAVFALSQHDDPRARGILRSVVEDGSISEGVRSKAIFWLGNEGTGDDIEFLKGRFGRTGSRALDEQVLVAVAQAERPQDADWLLSIASSDRADRGLREKAIFWAAEAGASARALGNLYDRLQDRPLKEKVLFGLSESDQPEAIDKLIEIARTETDPQLRKRAVFWLGNSNDPRAEDALMELLTSPRGG